MRSVPREDSSPHVRVAGKSPLPAEGVSSVLYSAASDIVARRPEAVYLLPFARVPSLPTDLREQSRYYPAGLSEAPVADSSIDIGMICCIGISC